VQAQAQNPFFVVVMCRNQMLDAIRYLVVWNPLLIVALHFALHFFGMDRFSKHRGDKEALMLMTNGTITYRMLAANATALNATQTMH